MARCETCGNEYERTFEIRAADGSTHTFDCFECAIHVLAPSCEHCGVRILGHGIEGRGAVYCCAHCAEQEGVTEVSDNAAHALASVGGRTQAADCVEETSMESFPASDPPGSY